MLYTVNVHSGVHRSTVRKYEFFKFWLEAHCARTAEMIIAMARLAGDRNSPTSRGIPEIPSVKNCLLLQRVNYRTVKLLFLLA
jgi:hypothetical protein